MNLQISTHKESSKVRIKRERDENDINKVILTLQTVMSNPFDEDAYRKDVLLMNLATGVVMPEEISEQLIDAQCLGAARMKLFVSKRINTNEAWFWDPMEKMNIKASASLSKKSKVKSVDEKLVTVSTEKELVWPAFDSLTIKGYRLERSLKVRAGLCPWRTGSS